MKISYRVLILYAILASVMYAQQPNFVTVSLTANDIEQCGGWPIARRWYASYIQKLETAGAERIFIDIAFVTSDPLHPESDEYLYEILRQYENVYLLTPAVQKDGAIVTILGNKEFPTVRTFSSFSHGFDFVEQHPILKDTTVLAAALLHGNPVMTLNKVVEYPSRILTSNHVFLDVLQKDIPFAGKDVILYIEYPGVTSFVVSPFGTKQVTTLLQVWTAEKIVSGESSRMLELWHYIFVALCCAFPLVFFGLKKRFYLGIIASASCSISSIPVLYFFHVFIPFWYFAVTGGWVITSVLLISISFISRMNGKKSNSLIQIEELVPNEELETLRYQLKYYEQLSQQFPPEQDIRTSDTANIIYHPRSPLGDILKKASQIAESTMPVLLSGESGTGKEKLALFIHKKSSRNSQPFIAVNCSSLNDGLIESELFGHEQGSFTGAIKTKIGRFELANGGTLFLDEIGETSPSFQAKILRVLQESIFERVGGTKEIRIDVRIIAATNKNLKELSKKGLFREDLFYRLHGFELEIPALRDRRDDIESLFKHFLYELDPKLSYSTQLIDWLKEQRWQGNVRQLQTATQRSVLNARMHNRTFIIPKDFELGPQSNSDHQNDGMAVAQKILDGLRSYHFDHKSIAKVSSDLSLHRSTVTEYFRGWVAHFLLRHPSSKQQFLEALLGESTIEDTERFEERIDAYVQYIQTNIADGLNARESHEEILTKRFRKLPIPFRTDITRLIEHQSQSQKK